jgi:hypothetical protein
MAHLGAHTFTQVPYPNRQRPAEYLGPGRGWWQGGQHRRVRKPHYAFIWPKDGRNGSNFGRMKDILSGKGPDMFVSVSVDKEDYMFNRPRRSRWAKQTELDDRDWTPNPKNPPWVREAREGKKYDFATRTYRYPDWKMFSDAYWYNTSSKKFPWPRAWRDMDGGWIQHNPNAFMDAMNAADGSIFV